MVSNYWWKLIRILFTFLIITNNIFAYYLFDQTLHPVGENEFSIFESLDPNSKGYLSFYGYMDANISINAERALKGKYIKNDFYIYYSNIKKESNLSINNSERSFSLKNESKKNLLSIGYELNSNIISAGLITNNDLRPGYLLNYKRIIKDKDYHLIELKYKLERDLFNLSFTYDDYSFASNDIIKSKSLDLSYEILTPHLLAKLNYNRVNYEDPNSKKLKLKNFFNQTILAKFRIHVYKKTSANFLLQIYSQESAMNFLNADDDIFYKINIISDYLRKNVISFDYQLDKMIFDLGYFSSKTTSFMSSRINVFELSNNLYDYFTVPMINGLDSLRIQQSGLFLKAKTTFKKSNAELVVSNGRNNIEHNNRLSTPPFNPLIPIIKREEGEIGFTFIDLSLAYTLKLSKYRLKIKGNRVFYTNLPNIPSIDDNTSILNLLGSQIEITLTYNIY